MLSNFCSAAFFCAKKPAGAAYFSMPYLPVHFYDVFLFSSVRQNRSWI